MFSPHLRQRPHYGEEEFARTMTCPSLFNPIFRPDRAYWIDNFRFVFCSDDNEHAAMPSASGLADYPPSKVLTERVDEIRFDDGPYFVILKTFSDCPRRSPLEISAANALHKYQIHDLPASHSAAW